MLSFAKALIAGEDGATTAENALMVGLIAAAAISVIGPISAALNAKLSLVAVGLSGTGR